MVLGSTQPSNRNEYQEYFLGGKDGRCVRLITYNQPVPLSRNLGTLTSWNPLGLSRPVMGTALPFTFHTKCAVAQLLEAQAGRSRVQFPMISLIFFMDIILPAALWPWKSTQPLTELSTGNISWDKGGRLS